MFHRQAAPARPTRRAFTLVELLVVIAVIAVLIALLVPAVQEAREGARMVQCRNNMRLVGQALSNYELNNRTFPPSTEWVAGSAAPFDQPWTRPNWVAAILPRLGLQALADRLDRSKSIADAANLSFRGANIESMLCPTDPYNRTPFRGAKYLMGDGWARGNYAVNSAQVTFNSNGVAGDAWRNPTFRGMMQCGVAVTAAKVTDGMSNTIMVCELRSGIDEIDPRGTWAMGDSASSIWGAGSFHCNVGGPWPGCDCNGPNPWAHFRMDQDNIVSCNDLWGKLGEEAVKWREAMGCWPDGSFPGARFNGQGCVRSRHRAGINVCLADGSVRFISDYIDTNGRIADNPPRFSVWDRLMASADGQVVPPDAF